MELKTCCPAPTNQHALQNCLYIHSSHIWCKTIKHILVRKDNCNARIYRLIADDNVAYHQIAFPFQIRRETRIAIQEPFYAIPYEYDVPVIEEIVVANYSLLGPYDDGNVAPTLKEIETCVKKTAKDYYFNNFQTFVLQIVDCIYLVGLKISCPGHIVYGKLVDETKFIWNDKKMPLI